MTIKEIFPSWIHYTPSQQRQGAQGVRIICVKAWRRIQHQETLYV